MNRIAAAIAKVAEKVNLDARALKRLNESATIDWEEYTTFQNVKSEMQVGGVITYDEAVTIYGILGNGPEAFNRQPLASRIVVMKTLQELLALKLQDRIARI